MARYNTVTTTTTSSGAATIGSPSQGLFTTLTGTAPYTLTLANPTLFIGQTQTFFNATGGVVTLSTPSGTIAGNGFTAASTQALPNNAIYGLTSDGTNYIVTNNEGGPIARTSLSATGAVTLSPAALVTISPTGGLTVSPSSVVGTIDNVNIGASTRGTGAFTTLASNSTTTLGATTATSINSTPIGASTASSGAFTSLSSNSTTSFTAGATVSGGTLSAAALSASGQISFTGNISSSGTGSGTVVVTGGMGISGTLYVTSLVESSSLTFKENISPINNALDSILQLVGVSYDRRDTKQHEIGLIAEHVHKVIPDLVALDEHGKPYGIHYTKLSAYLIESIKALQQEINDLKGSNKDKR